MLAGEYIIYLEEHEVACPAGSFVYIPAGMRHGFKVGAVASRKLNLYTPAAMMGYFDELSDALRSGRVDDEHLSAIALRYSMEVVGPVPEDVVTNNALSPFLLADETAASPRNRPWRSSPKCRENRSGAVLMR